MQSISDSAKLLKSRWMPKKSAALPPGWGLRGTATDPSALKQSKGLPQNRVDWPTFWRNLFEERAGLLEFDDGFPRAEAEARAEDILRQHYERQYPVVEREPGLGLVGRGSKEGVS